MRSRLFTWRVTQAIVGIILLVSGVVAESRAQLITTKDTCLTNKSIEQIERQIEDTYERNSSIPLTHVDLQGDRLEVFMAALNRNPPQSRLVADRAIVFISPAMPDAFVILGYNSCVTTVANFPLQTTLFWMRGRVVKAFYQ